MSVVPHIALVVATFLCSLVAGFLFAFAVVVMPGIRGLPNREFLAAFQQMDAVIQQGRPLFGLVWVGSALTLIIGIASGLGEAGTWQVVLLVLAGGVYLLGVQLPTFVINVPLNNELQALDISRADDATLRSARQRFEPTWNRWNRIRTAFAALTTALLLAFLTILC
ncbi:MAG: DUF1772 domain-containing protein [Gemmatimonadota bacterium]